MTDIPKTSVRLHLTNVTGLGASQLLQSLLPLLEQDPVVRIECIYLPDSGAMSNYRSQNAFTLIEVYKRVLPNSLSRIFECTFGASHFDGDLPLLVFGDLPLRCRGPQIVFVQQSNLLRPDWFKRQRVSLRYLLARGLFFMNRHRVSAFIVQTDVMRDALERSYPSIAGKVHVIPQPVPSWLLSSGLCRKARVHLNLDRLRLIYPAAGYPHKNHVLLSRLDLLADWPIEELMLTLSETTHPAPQLSWVQCVGYLSPEKMIEAYSKVDALLFLSKEESYGFPLLEAMFVGLPIVCPDLPYARALCGDNGIYFDPDNSDSLLEALKRLQYQFKQGWWPNWEDRLLKIPKDWETVARKMLALTAEHRFASLSSAT